MALAVLVPAPLLAAGDARSRSEGLFDSRWRSQIIIFCVCSNRDFSERGDTVQALRCSDHSWT